VQDLQLIALAINLDYTWIRRNAARRIDRILVEAQFLDAFPMLSACCKDRVLSYHHPVVMSTSQLTWGPIPFRILDYWPNEPKFIKVFKNKWLQLTGLPFHKKLVKMRAPLKKWNWEIFGHIDQRIQSFQREMAKLDLIAQERELNEVEWHRRSALQSQL